MSEEKEIPSDSWETPRDVFEDLSGWLGPIGFDVCASPANTKVPGRYFSPPQDDALKKDWSALRCFGALYMNPPYSDPTPWIIKASMEAERGCTVIALLPGDTSTRWFHDHIYDFPMRRPRPGKEIIFWPRRIRFIPPAGLVGKDGTPIKACTARFPSLVVVFRPPLGTIFSRFRAMGDAMNGNGKPVTAHPHDPINQLTEELTFIVKTADVRALDAWINKYVRKITVTQPVIPYTALAPVSHAGLNPVKVAQAKVAGNLAVAVSPGCVWSETTDVVKAEKGVRAELYFLDVLGKVGGDGKG